jgi:hypothetical protein
MVNIKAVALRWVSDEPQPGLVEVAIIDAFGIEHRIIDKNAVVGPEDPTLMPDSPYPVDFSIKADAELDGEHRVTVTLPWFMETTSGETRLTMSNADLLP